MSAITVYKSIYSVSVTITLLIFSNINYNLYYRYQNIFVIFIINYKE